MWPASTRDPLEQLSTADGAEADVIPLRSCWSTRIARPSCSATIQVDSIHCCAMLYSDRVPQRPAPESGLALYTCDSTSRLAPRIPSGESDRQQSSRTQPQREERRAPAPRPAHGRTPLWRRKPWPRSEESSASAPCSRPRGGHRRVRAVLWFGLLPQYAGALTSSRHRRVDHLGLLHEFGHAFVAYLGGDRSVRASTST